MAEYTFGTPKVNGNAAGGEALTLTMDFWTLTTAVNILTYSDTYATAYAAAITAGQDVPTAKKNADAAALITQAALNKLVEIISLRGQPVILSAPTVASNVYTVKFAIEHAGSWGSDSTALIAAVKSAGVNFGFAADNTLAANLKNNL